MYSIDETIDEIERGVDFGEFEPLWQTLKTLYSLNSKTTSKVSHALRVAVTLSWLRIVLCVKKLGIYKDSPQDTLHCCVVIRYFLMLRYTVFIALWRILSTAMQLFINYYFHWDYK